MGTPLVICPKCEAKEELQDVLTAQSNQNVIFTCPRCSFVQKNIQTSKG